MVPTRLPRPTTRRLMAMVALVAVALGVMCELSRRRERFEGLAAGHSRVAMEHWGTLMAMGVAPSLPPAPRDAPSRYLNRQASLFHHHLRLNQKYERAARYAWLAVPPDPRPPK